MCPDSAIARSFSCGRTKATAITKTLAQDRTEAHVEALKNGTFSVSTDDSNDYKLYLIVVRYSNSEVGIISTPLRVLPCLKRDSTGLNIANLIISDSIRSPSRKKNCLAFSTDNRARKSRDYLASRCEIHAIIGSLGTVRAQPRFRSHVKSMGDFRLLQITVI